MYELAISDAVQLEIVKSIVPAIVAVTALLPVIALFWKKLTAVEKQTNGRLTETEAKVDKAESRLPGITQDHPPGTEIQARMSVNDPATADPPVVIEKFTRQEKP